MAKSRWVMKAHNEGNKLKKKKFYFLSLDHSF